MFLLNFPGGIVIMSVVKMKLRIKIDISALYAGIAVFFGVIMAFLVPPFQVPDEENHFYQSVSISHGQLFCESGNIDLPEEYIDLVEAMEPTSLAFQGDVRFEKDRVLKYVPSDDEDVFTYESALCRVFSVAYAPSAIGVATAGLFTNNELFQFYAGRLLNLVCAVLLSTAAIKISPFGKRLLAWIALLPMSVFMFSSFNYDSLFIPAALLFISTVMRAWKRGGDLSIIEILLLCFLTILIINIKLPYALLLFVPSLFLSVKKKKSSRYVVLLLLGVGIVCFFLATYLSPALPAPEWTNPLGQVNFISAHFFSYPVILARTFYRNFLYYFLGVIGLLGWLDYQLPPVGYVLSVLAGGSALLLDGAKKIFRVPQRMFIVTMAVVTVLGIMTSMYIYSSREGWPMIEGVQGRYFIPLLFPVFLVMSEKTPQIVSVRNRLYLCYFMWLCMVAVLILTVVATYQRYYGGA